MTESIDPTLAIQEKAASFEEVVTGTSCNQTSFKTKRGSFLFIGPGAKGFGFKAMFKLGPSLPEAQKLALDNPKQFEVGSAGWVTARFTRGEPLSDSIWEKWLHESYSISRAPRRK